METRNDAVINPNTTVRGTVDVIGGIAQVNGTSTFLSTATVSITTDGELALNGATDFQGGSYQGQGTLQWNGEVTVAADTEMDVRYVDMDGTSGTTVSTLNGSQLTLNVDAIDTANNVNRFDGTLNMSGGSNLTVHLNNPGDSWQMNGIMYMNAGTNTLAGSPVWITGSVNVSGLGNGFIAAPMDLSGNITTDLGTSTLRLVGGTHAIRNTATVSGPGELWIEPGGHMMAEDGTAIGVDFVNSGPLRTRIVDRDGLRRRRIPPDGYGHAGHGNRRRAGCQSRRPAGNVHGNPGW